MKKYGNWISFITFLTGWRRTLLLKLFIVIFVICLEMALMLQKILSWMFLYVYKSKNITLFMKKFSHDLVTIFHQSKILKMNKSLWKYNLYVNLLLSLCFKVVFAFVENLYKSLTFVLDIYYSRVFFIVKVLLLILARNINFRA